MAHTWGDTGGEGVPLPVNLSYTIAYYAATVCQEIVKS